LLFFPVSFPCLLFPFFELALVSRCRLRSTGDGIVDGKRDLEGSILGDRDLEGELEGSILGVGDGALVGL